MSAARKVPIVVAVALLWGLGPSASAQQGSPSGPCGADWVVAEQTAARERGEHFGILPGTRFEERGYAYITGIFVPEGPDTASLTFVIFGRQEGERRVVHAEPIATLAPSMTRLAVELGRDCVVPPASPWFAVTVDDLDADGRHEILVESNISGGCRDCLSELRVYQVRGATAVKALHEAYSQLIFGKGRGLFLQSVTRGPDGESIPVTKTFFVPSSR